MIKVRSSVLPNLILIIIDSFLNGHKLEAQPRHEPKPSLHEGPRPRSLIPSQIDNWVLGASPKHVERKCLPRRLTALARRDLFQVFSVAAADVLHDRTGTQRRFHSAAAAVFHCRSIAYSPSSRKTHRAGVSEAGTRDEHDGGHNRPSN